MKQKRASRKEITQRTAIRLAPNRPRLHPVLKTGVVHFMSRLPYIIWGGAAATLLLFTGCKPDPETNPSASSQNADPAVRNKFQNFTPAEKQVWQRWQSTPLLWRPVAEWPRSKFLSAADQEGFFRILHQVTCPCGCGMRLAECRVHDPDCPVSPQLVDRVYRAWQSGTKFFPGLDKQSWLEALRLPPIEAPPVWPVDNPPLVSATWPGKPTLLVFFATWCGPCRAELPVLRRLKSSKLFAGGEKIRLVGLSVDHELSDADLRKILKRWKPPYPVYRGSEVTQVEYQATSLPAAYLFDRDGLLIHRFKGLTTFKEFRKVAAALTSSP